MVGGEPQKQLLSLIRNFASEKSQEERRVSNLKKRLVDLQNDLDAANAALDISKRFKEATELELSGSQVRLSLIDATIQPQEARIAQLQEQILKLHSDLDAIKNKEGAERDEFIKTMCNLNEKIRKFQVMTITAFEKEQLGRHPSGNGKKHSEPKEVLHMQDTLKLNDLQDKITCIKDQIQELDAEYLNEQRNHEKTCEALSHIERRLSLVMSIMEEIKQLQDITERTTQLEKDLASLGEDLHKKATCPDCGLDNIEDGRNEDDGSI